MNKNLELSGVIIPLCELALEFYNNAEPYVKSLIQACQERGATGTKKKLKRLLKGEKIKNILNQPKNKHQLSPADNRILTENINKILDMKNETFDKDKNFLESIARFIFEMTGNVNVTQRLNIIALKIK